MWRVESPCVHAARANVSTVTTLPGLPFFPIDGGNGATKRIEGVAADSQHEQEAKAPDSAAMSQYIKPSGPGPCPGPGLSLGLDPLAL